MRPLPPLLPSALPRSLSLCLLLLLLFGCGDRAVAPTNPTPAPAPLETEAPADDYEHPPVDYYDSVAQIREAYDPGQYDSRFRPLYHFTLPQGQLDKPTSLLHHAGEWHLFYQYSLDSDQSTTTAWGHAVSPDLFNWKPLPLEIEMPGSGHPSSGSVVVDTDNSSGLGSDTEPALVALFNPQPLPGKDAKSLNTPALGLAYSTDRGRTWATATTAPTTNSAILQELRDPQVFRDEAHQQWTMIAAGNNGLHFLRSTNLQDWEYLSEFRQEANHNAGKWASPNLLLLPIQQRNYDPWGLQPTGKSAYALIVSTYPGGRLGGSGANYFVGDWDGTHFKPHPTPDDDYLPYDTERWLDYGQDYYAAVITNTGPDGRHLLIGSMTNRAYANQTPTEGWRGALTMPRELFLFDGDFGYRLHQQAAQEISTRRGRRIPITVPKLEDGLTTIDLTGLEHKGVFELDITVDLMTVESQELYFTLHDADNKYFYRFGLSRSLGWFTDRDQAGLTEFSDAFTREDLNIVTQYSNETVVRLRAFFDKSSAEVFFYDGAMVATDRFYPTQPLEFLTVEVSGGQNSPDGTTGFPVEAGVVWELK